jgi:ACS family hexuronate transporter-like MFS transporter
MPTTPNRRRWIIFGLLFSAWVLSYFDRQALSMLKPAIKAEFGLKDSDYSVLITLFMAPYVVMYVLGGRIVDRVGSRLTLSIFNGVWAATLACVGLVRSAWQFGACRFVLGSAAPCTVPAAIRTISILFPSEQRGVVIGVFGAASTVGTILAPPLVAFVASRYGWRSAFWITGIIGLAWVVAWRLTFRASDDEVSSDEATRPQWRKIVRSREVWGLVSARLISDPVWYFYLFWLPGYFQENLGLSLTQAGAVVWIPWLAANLGGICSGWVSDTLVRRGLEPLTARKRVLLCVTMIAPLGVLVPHMSSIVGVLLVTCPVAAMCLTWTVGTPALISDIFPKNAIGGIVGISQAAGAAGGLLFNSQVGRLVEHSGYTPIFLCTGLLHPIAAIILYTQVRRKSVLPLY